MIDSALQRDRRLARKKATGEFAARIESRIKAWMNMPRPQGRAIGKRSRTCPAWAENGQNEVYIGNCVSLLPLSCNCRSRRARTAIVSAWRTANVTKLRKSRRRHRASTRARSRHLHRRAAPCGGGRRLHSIAGNAWCAIGWPSRCNTPASPGQGKRKMPPVPKPAPVLVLDRRENGSHAHRLTRRRLSIANPGDA